MSNDELTSREQLAVTQKGFLTEVSGADINASHIIVVKQNVNVSRPLAVTERFFERGEWNRY